MVAKSLKAKTTKRRAAKPAKKRKTGPECPVKHLGHEQMNLIKALTYTDTKIKTAQGDEKADLQETHQFIADAMIANREAASFLQPSSGEGATFLLLCIHSDVWHMAGANDAQTRGEYQRRIDRKYEAHCVLIEDTMTGKALRQELRQSGTLRSLPWRPTIDKITRMEQQTPKIEAGRVFLPKDAPWLHEFKVEMLAFPNGKHDDQVDTLSQFLSWIGNRQWQRSEPTRPQTVDRPLGPPRISRSTWYTRNRPALGSNADLLRRYGGSLYW